MSHFAPFEAQSYPDLVSLGEKLDRALDLRIEIVLFDPAGELYLLDLDRLLFLLILFFFLVAKSTMNAITITMVTQRPPSGPNLPPVI